MNKNENEKLVLAQKDFERMFGVSEETNAYVSEYGGENVIVVENHYKRAYYSFSVELLKVLKF